MLLDSCFPYSSKTTKASSIAATHPKPPPPPNHPLVSITSAATGSTAFDEVNIAQPPPHANDDDNNYDNAFDAATQRHSRQISPLAPFGDNHSWDAIISSTRPATHFAIRPFRIPIRRTKTPSASKRYAAPCEPPPPKPPPSSSSSSITYDGNLGKATEIEYAVPLLKLAVSPCHSSHYYSNNNSSSSPTSSLNATWRLHWWPPPPSPPPARINVDIDDREIGNSSTTSTEASSLFEAKRIFALSAKDDCLRQAMADANNVLMMRDGDGRGEVELDETVYFVEVRLFYFKCLPMCMWYV